MIKDVIKAYEKIAVYKSIADWWKPGESNEINI